MSKLTITGIISLILGLVCGVIQNIFFGFIDAECILHDSFFLPLSFMFLAMGILILVVQMLSSFIFKKK